VHQRIRWLIVLLAIALLVPCSMAFTVSRTSVDPELMNPADPVNVSCTVYAASGTAFSEYDDLQFVTALDDPVWTYTLIVNNVQNTRPDERGKTMTIGGYELAYTNQDEVTVNVGLRGHLPATAATGANISLLKIQELDARSNVITSTVIVYSHLVGLPTPTPAPAYGSVAIASAPSGANVYLDNVIRGITPVTIDAVPNGRHTVLLRLDGYEDYSEAVVVTGDTHQVDAGLTGRSVPAITTSVPAAGTTTVAGGATVSTRPAVQAGTGTLSVTTTPDGALVYIDGQMKGITPATIPGLAAGNHSVKLIRDGYQDFETSTVITPGTTSEFITGLSKRKQSPGFTGAIALAAIGLLLAARVIRKKP
jgi:hypothetical protein